MIYLKKKFVRVHKSYINIDKVERFSKFAEITTKIPLSRNKKKKISLKHYHSLKRVLVKIYVYYNFNSSVLSNSIKTIQYFLIVFFVFITEIFTGIFMMIVRRYSFLILLIAGF
jgi:hypothetical protein